MTLSFRPVGETFVAEVCDIDLAGLLDTRSLDILHKAYLDYKVLTIRGQALTAKQFQTVGEQFGTIEAHVVSLFHHEDSPGITILSNRVEMGRPKGIRDAGSHWHSDYSYKATPANATLLYALEVPAEGGDTLFADLAAAYEALPSDIKQRIHGRYARHQYRWHRNRDNPEGRWLLLTEQERRNTPEVVHPLVRRHPETGAQSIYAFPGITSGVMGIEGLPQDESDALLDALYTHCTQERFQYRYKWQTGDVVIWDNRATMHCATTDKLDPDQYRTLWRLNTTGSTPIPG